MTSLAGTRETGDFGSVGDWAQRVGIILDGKPFSFQRHEYLYEPYTNTCPYTVEMKAAQMGCTTRAMLYALFGLRFKGYHGVLYLFPSRTDVLDFSKGRVSPLIEENPETLGKWLLETDSAGLKRVWGGHLYLRGMQSRVGLKSIPVDFVIFDELDEAPPASVDLAMERMSHSEFRETLKLSNPTLPDYGVDKAFSETDQRFWLLKCQRCGEYTCLEDTFPECLLEVGPRVIRACQKCKKELNPAIGEWVAKRSSVQDKRGYHYSQLFSQFVSPAEILELYQKTNNLQDFWNLKIGLAYVSATDRLTIEEVLALCGSEGIANTDPGPTYMGCDQGRDLHVVIGRKHPGKAGKIIHLGIYQSWEELDVLMKRFNVIRCIVDGLPEQRNARSFAERHKGKVFLNFYNEHQKGFYRWDEKNLTVSCNRTEALDASHNEILNGEIILPRENEIVQEFAQHLHNVAKKLEEDPETGSRRYIYLKLGPDHYRHAFSYEAMARQSTPDLLFPEMA